MSNKEIPYSEVIAKKVKEDTRNGVLVKDTMAYIQRYQNAPKSSATFYKLYYKDIAETRAETFGAIGSVVVQQALDGCFKSQELVLRSKGGWSPTQTNIEVEADVSPDEDMSAVDTMMTLLGKNNGSDASEDNS